MSFQIMRAIDTHRMLRYGSNVGVPGANEEIVVIANDALMAQLEGIASAIINNDGSFATVPLDLPIIKEDQPGVPDVLLVTQDGATPQAVQLFRATIPTQTLYIANFKLRGIDPNNGNRRYIDATYMIARLNAGAVIDSSAVTFNGFNNAAAQAWGITASIDPNATADFVIQVTGQANRTIEWVLKTTVHRFRPSGLA
jgi:hypothetical protein